MDHTAYKYKIRADETVLGGIYKLHGFMVVRIPPRSDWPERCHFQTLSQDGSEASTWAASKTTVLYTDQLPKSDLPPGFVRIRDLEPGDYYVATGYRPALTAASLIPDNIGRLKKKATKNHSAEISTQGGLTLHEDSDTPVYPIDASFARERDIVGYFAATEPAKE